MPRGGQNRKSAAAKQLAGTHKPSRHRESPVPVALDEWPDAPDHFSEGEVKAWVRLGAAVMELGSVSKADLLFCERVAQVSARVDDAMASTEFKATALNALLRLEADLRRQLGISPQARRAVDPLAQEADEEEDPLDEFSVGHG